MKKYLAWIPALVIMTAIFWFSAQPADVSTEMSDSVTQSAFVDGGGCGAYGPAVAGAGP